jgi:hypothetical protein
MQHAEASKPDASRSKQGAQIAQNATKSASRSMNAVRASSGGAILLQAGPTGRTQRLPVSPC